MAGRRILVINERAGSAQELPDVFAGFERMDLDEFANGDVPALLAKRREQLRLGSSSRLAGMPELVAVWGGDGTCRAVAQHMVGTDVALLPCPGGTHNHFAHAASIHDADDVAAALDADVRLAVDVGVIGAQIFLNNATFGWYADLVARRERYEQHLPRRLAKMISSVVQLVRVRRRRLVIDGVAERVWMVWVGNGAYSLDPTDLARRDDLADGQLDIRVLRAGRHFPKLAAFAALVTGRAERSDALQRRLAATCAVNGRHRLEVTLDGELVELRAPVTLRCRPRSLTLALPALPIDQQPIDQQPADQHAG